MIHQTTNWLMNVVELIATKRDGGRLEPEQIKNVVDGFSGEGVPDYQMAALAMAIWFNGMDHEEVVALTRSMLHSGKVFSWQGINRRVVDKHSTGGIGDKVSIVLAPLLAAAGFAVPMISGRGLGATGGTLDKLESIPGFQVDMSMEQIRRQVEETGCVIASAGPEIAPADRRMYALRDVTATVASVPLITASILSKKLAEGLDALVLDVKFGSGAFMKSRESARELAVSLVDVASELGLTASALLTDMNQPLGRMVGNSCEVNESLDVLKGKGPDDLRELTIELAFEVVRMAGEKDEATGEKDEATSRARIASLLDGGEAMECFERMVAAQGGRLSGPLPCAPVQPLLADRDGWIAITDAEQMGWAVIDMGGGRKSLEDPLDHSTGLEILVRVGDQVEKGQPLVNVFCRTAQFATIERRLRSAIPIVDEPVAALPLIGDRIRPDSC